MTIFYVIDLFGVIHFNIPLMSHCNFTHDSTIFPHSQSEKLVTRLGLYSRESLPRSTLLLAALFTTASDSEQSGS